MSLPTLADLKWHLRLEQEPDTENDPYLELILDAAVDHAAQHLGHPIPWASEDSSEAEVPASVRAAVLLIAADLYEHREAQIVGAAISENQTVVRLLSLYRTGLGV